MKKAITSFEPLRGARITPGVAATPRRPDVVATPSSPGLCACVSFVWAARRGRRDHQRAFTLIEIMIVVTLLSLIIVGLVAMFAGTQRAFRASMTQVDIMEGGRAVTELLTRDLAQVSPCVRTNGINFYVRSYQGKPLIQALPGNTTIPGRTNVIQELFFLNRENQTWTGIGYRVGNVTNGLGSLYRFSDTYGVGGDPAYLYLDYYNTPLTNMSRILDGVVHFKVRAFDTDGNWITTNDLPNAIVQEPFFALYAPGEVEFYSFTSNIIPASVEVELGILEQRSLERARAIPAGTARSNYLAQQASKVHLFRLRVPVRNVDPAAYQ